MLKNKRHQGRKISSLSLSFFIVIVIPYSAGRTCTVVYQDVSKCFCQMVLYNGDMANCLDFSVHVYLSNINIL